MTLWRHAAEVAIVTASPTAYNANLSSVPVWGGAARRLMTW